MEGTHERPQELAIFCANGLQVFEIKHVVGHVENLSYQEQVDKKIWSWVNSSIETRIFR